MEPFEDKFHMDGIFMGFRKEVFDKIVCVAVLHHLPSAKLQK